MTRYETKQSKFELWWNLTWNFITGYKKSYWMVPDTCAGGIARVHNIWDRHHHCAKANFSQWFCISAYLHSSKKVDTWMTTLSKQFGSPEEIDQTGCNSAVPYLSLVFRNISWEWEIVITLQKERILYLHHQYCLRKRSIQNKSTTLPKQTLPSLSQINEKEWTNHNKKSYQPSTFSGLPRGSKLCHVLKSLLLNWY